MIQPAASLPVVPYPATIEEFNRRRLLNDVWPKPLQSHVQTLGAEFVWNKGLQVLGYPPTWCEARREFNALVVRLK